MDVAMVAHTQTLPDKTDISLNNNSNSYPNSEQTPASKTFLTSEEIPTSKTYPSSQEPPGNKDCPSRVDPPSSEDIPNPELALLAKLEEANRLYEQDAKSLPNLTSTTTHSRNNSESSQLSYSSGNGTCAERIEDSEEDAWTLWNRIVTDWPNYSKKQNAALKELVRKGIPRHFRAIAWQLLCDATGPGIREQYAAYIKATSACEKVIRRDIARTYPEHDFFKEKDGLGQESLFNVMKAYSLHDREVGYCQGSGFIVGLLLMQMPEEDTFAVLVKIMQDYRMRDMFKPSMAELGLCMFQLENLVKELLPELDGHFMAQGFHTSMYASSWFLTLFATTLTLPLACRIMDAFLSEGMDVIFKVALALLTLGKDELLSLDMEGMLKYFQRELPPKAEADPDGLMNSAYTFKLNSKKMKKMEKEYTTMKMKEQEEMQELKRLRSENKLLRRRVELLEAESSALADRLVQGQVSRAEEEENVFTVQRELQRVQHLNLELSHQLEMAHDEMRNLAVSLEQSHSSQQSSISEISMKREQLSDKEDLVACLQTELVKVRLSEAENAALLRDMRARIEDLEQDKKTLREASVDNSVAHLQEELIAVKLREAEANLSLKELRHRTAELQSQWQRHLAEHRMEATPAPDSTPKKMLFWESRSSETQRLEEELMTSRIREMDALTELKELRLKLMELETQVQVSTNQLRRQDEENKQLREKLEGQEKDARDAQAKLKEQRNKYSDLESKMKDDLMMSRINDAEHTQIVAELRQKISRLELKNHEMVAEGELKSNVEDSDRVKDLQDEVAYFKAEVMRLEKWKEKKLTGSCRTVSVDTESEHEETTALHIQLDDADAT